MQEARRFLQAALSPKIMSPEGDPEPARIPRVEESLELFSRTGDGVWAVDADQRIVVWNDAAQTLLGYTAGEVLGKHCYELLQGRDTEGRPCCRDGCRVRARAQQGRAVEAFNLRVRRRDRQTTSLSVSVIAVPEESGAAGRIALVHLFRELGQRCDWPPPLRICLLGPVTVERSDGSAVDGPLWRRAKVRALLALLVLRHGQPVRRETLLEMLWPELPYTTALRNLNTTVYNLRRSLEPTLSRGSESEYIAYQGGCYVLNGGRIHSLDVDVFEGTIALAHRQRDPERARALLQEALDLYRGDLVSDLEPDLVGGWHERERLRELYLSTLEELGALCAREGRLVEASQLYFKVMSWDLCREGAARELMRLAVLRGNRQEAVAHYRRLKRALRQELDVSPEEQTRLLYEQIVTHRA